MTRDPSTPGARRPVSEPPGSSGFPERILLSHGAGGRQTQELIARQFVPPLANPILETLSDGALLPRLPEGHQPVLTTDAFVVDPPIFPGGDAGYLSVCGTVNDLVVSGAEPLYLTWALILEEGAPGSLVERCVAGAARAAAEAGVRIVAGDTKVVPRGKGDRIYITSAGLGARPLDLALGDERIVPGDALLVSGSIGDHGATIMALRHRIDAGALRSDCAPLATLLLPCLRACDGIKAFHDPTRGGVATTCHEVARRTGLRMHLQEEALPVRPEVRATAELLGLDEIHLPCEGRALIWVAAEEAEALLARLRAHPLGRGAERIGRVTSSPAGEDAPVVLENALGVTRPVDLLSGAGLPRIC
ncbi:MAG: hydrogenase expression/formation protein HypE [Candidatus Eisenbacteria bacterium]|nr:hydrogenase expression/formation protein HypE [Candidatus Eisenbacteria bacterium]